MLYRIIKKEYKQNFLDNWTIRIQIFWRFRCREQVNKLCFFQTMMITPFLTISIFFFSGLEFDFVSKQMKQRNKKLVEVSYFQKPLAWQSSRRRTNKHSLKVWPIETFCSHFFLWWSSEWRFEFEIWIYVCNTFINKIFDKSSHFKIKFLLAKMTNILLTNIFNKSDHFNYQNLSKRQLMTRKTNYVISCHHD